MDLQQIFDNTDFVHASGTKEEWIVLTAHYDTTSLSHGAYDNMSGCAGLLGIMEYMKDKSAIMVFGMLRSSWMSIFSVKEKKHKRNLPIQIMNQIRPCCLIWFFHGKERQQHFFQWKLTG